LSHLETDGAVEVTAPSLEDFAATYRDRRHKPCAVCALPAETLARVNEALRAGTHSVKLLGSWLTAVGYGISKYQVHHHKERNHHV
jgi:hypothetical protein